jgi:serine phosphatase RsbU (regulator of sigma subunit)
VLSDRVDISRQHLEIIRNGANLLVQDLDSDFGTYVNRNRIQSAELSHGDQIHLASFDLPELLYLDRDDSEATFDAGPAQEQTTQIHDLQVISHVADTFRSIGSGGVLSDLLTRIADNAIELSGADRGFIMLAEGNGRLAVHIARGRKKINLGAESFQTSQVIPLEVIESGETKVLEFTTPVGKDNRRDTPALGIRSAVCVPLNPIQITEGRPEGRGLPPRVGVLYLDSRSTIHLCSPYALPLIEGLAEEAAVAIQNVRLLQESERAAQDRQTIRVAGEIQASLQPPRNRKGPFFEVAGSTVPCEEVGGDFLDYPLLEGGSRLGLALADVAGKRLPGAILAAMVQGTFAALATREQSPAGVLYDVNQTLAVRDNPSRFVTFFYGVLYPDGRLRSCNAGHTPGMVVRHDGRIDKLEAGGIPLGIYEDQSYEEEAVRLEPGELIVVFSDGVTEASSASKELFGELRLKTCLCRYRNSPVEEILACIDRLVRDFVQNGPLQDDMTILVARYLGQGKPR